MNVVSYTIRQDSVGSLCVEQPCGEEPESRGAGEGAGFPRFKIKDSTELYCQYQLLHVWSNYMCLYNTNKLK